MTPTTSSQPPPSADTERAASRGARVALLAFLALCSLFVLSSTWQLLQGALYGATAPAASDERRIDFKHLDDLRRLPLFAVFLLRHADADFVIARIT